MINCFSCHMQNSSEAYYYYISNYFIYVSDIYNKYKYIWFLIKTIELVQVEIVQVAMGIVNALPDCKVVACQHARHASSMRKELPAKYKHCQTIPAYFSCLLIVERLRCNEIRLTLVFVSLFKYFGITNTNITVL